MQRAIVPMLIATAACATERPVEAPLVADVSIARADAGAGQPLLIEPQPSARTRDDASAIVGSWEGIGTQDDQTSWPMTVEIRSTHPGVCATADYPSIPCSAEWICVRSRDGTLEARERLLGDSRRRCIDNGTMRMSVTDDGALDWRWTGSGESASATLSRR